MTAVDEDATLDAGEWGVFVARTVREIRRDLGEAAASRVATLLHAQKHEAIEASRAQLHETREQLARARADVDEARAAHTRLQADLTRMTQAVTEAKTEAAKVRNEALDLATRRRAELDALAESEAQRLADAWEEVHRQEEEVAARRSQLLDLDDHAARRMTEIEEAAAELAAVRAGIETDRAEAQRLVAEAIARLTAIESDAATRAAEEIPDDHEPEIDLREQDLDLRRVGLDERQRELDEWEADLVRRSRGLDQRPSLPPPGTNVSGWGRRARRD